MSESNIPEAEKPFYKPGGEFCTECPGRRNDHADYCTVAEQIEAAKRAVLEAAEAEKEQEEMEAEQ